MQIRPFAADPQGKDAKRRSTLLFQEWRCKVKNSAGKVGKGIDVRGAESYGYVLAAGSDINGKSYEWVKEPNRRGSAFDSMAEAPSWLIDRMPTGARAERGPMAAKPLCALDQGHNVELARHLIRKIEPAIQGAGGREHAMQLSRELHDRAISPDKQFELLTEPFVKEEETEALSWNERCSPPWSLSSDCAKQDDLEYLLQESWRSCTDRPGCKTEEGRAAQAQEEFEPVELEDSGVGADGAGERVYTSADETRANQEASVSYDDFFAYMPMHNYIYTPSGDPWPASSVDSRLPPQQDSKGKPIRPSTWLDRNRPVAQMTWAPGEPQLIEGRLALDGGWIERPGVGCFNLYRPPTIPHGMASEAGAWLRHIERVYPEDARHIVLWLAHRVQRPHEKINHALLLGGAQGVGKGHAARAGEDGGRAVELF